jgi:hypothetical protein
VKRFRVTYHYAGGGPKTAIEIIEGYNVFSVLTEANSTIPAGWRVDHIEEITEQADILRHLSDQMNTLLYDRPWGDG